jgi:polysaccharide biosynthesis transport protein
MGEPDFADILAVSQKNLRDYVDVILRRGWVAAIVFVFVVLITVAYTLTRTPLYTSVASLEIEENSSKIKDKDSVYGQPQYDQFKGYLATQLEILKSKSLAETLVTRMNLLEHPEFNAKNWITTVLSWFSMSLPGPPESNSKKWVSTVSSWFSADMDVGTSPAPKDAKKRRIADQLLRRITVKPVKQSNLIQISVDATNPRLASNILQNHIGLYLEQNLEKRRQESLQTAVWLKEELGSVDKRLRDSQVAFLDFIVDHGIVDSKDGALAQVLSLVNKTMEGHVKSQEAQAKVEAMDQQTVQEGAGLLLPKEVNNEYLGKLKQDLAMMESEYTQMRGLYATNYPKLIMLDKKIRFLRQRIATIEKNLVSSALDMARKEEMLIRGSLDSAKKEASRVRSLEAQYASLKKDVDTNTEFQSILLKEYKQMDIRARTISNDIRIVDSPSVPHKQSWPKTHLFLLIGCVVGLVVGTVSAFVAEQLDDTVQSPREIDVNFKAKRLGSVPHIEKLAGRGNPTVTTPYEFLAYDHPKTAISDAIRNIQASIFLSNPASPVQCMIVTSASPSEGKTLVAASIATVLTSGPAKKVLIADADLRKGRLHKVFGNGNSRVGLSDFLTDRSIRFSNVIQSHRIRGLFYMPAGSIPRDPVLLLQSERMKRVIEKLRNVFDYIVIDCPPILGLPDVPMICNKADGVILVAKQGHVGRHELQEAMDVLSSVAGSKLLGIVMNMAHAPGWYGYTSRYGSRSDYGYHHKYYSRTA